MKKESANGHGKTRTGMLREYDFAEGQRGKHYKSYRRGHSVIVTRANGSFSVKYFGLRDGAVMLEPDVQDYFPDSKAVNRALRALIKLAPQKRLQMTGRKRNAIRL